MCHSSNEISSTNGKVDNKVTPFSDDDTPPIKPAIIKSDVEAKKLVLVFKVLIIVTSVILASLS
jgi:hypothetical protein